MVAIKFLVRREHDPSLHRNILILSWSFNFHTFCHSIPLAALEEGTWFAQNADLTMKTPFGSNSNELVKKRANWDWNSLERNLP